MAGCTVGWHSLTPPPAPPVFPFLPSWPGDGADEGSRESVDSKCRQLTATWVREKAPENPDIELCEFFEGHEKAGGEALLPPGVYTLHDIRYPPPPPLALAHTHTVCLILLMSCCCRHSCC